MILKQHLQLKKNGKKGKIKENLACNNVNLVI